MPKFLTQGGQHTQRGDLRHAPDGVGYPSAGVSQARGYPPKSMSDNEQ